LETRFGSVAATSLAVLVPAKAGGRIVLEEPHPFVLPIDTARALSVTNNERELPTFSRAANASLDRTRGTYEQRGWEYGDSWALPNIHSPLTEYVLNLTREGVGGYRAWLRLLRAAVLADTKESRLQGNVNIDDHLIDGIAYRATFAELLREYEGR
jgi:hypothetical protein